MRYINLYLIGYIVFVIGAILALWRAGILDRIGPAWFGIGLVIAIGLGIMLSVGSGKPDITRE